MMSRKRSNFGTITSFQNAVNESFDSIAVAIGPPRRRVRYAAFYPAAPRASARSTRPRAPREVSGVLESEQAVEPHQRQSGADHDEHHRPRDEQGRDLGLLLRELHLRI